MTLQRTLALLLLTLFVVQNTYGDCFPQVRTIQELIESTTFGTRNLFIRATLLEKTVSIPCPVNVYITDYVDTVEGFGVLQVEEVFRGNATVWDEITFVYSTDTGDRQSLPGTLETAAKSTDGILVLLSQRTLSCSDDTDTSALFSINECDFGANGVPLDGWSSVSSDDMEYLRSFAADVSLPSDPMPAAQPTRSTLSPTPLPTASSVSMISTALALSMVMVHL